LADTNRAAFSGRSTVLTLASGCHEAVATSMPAGVATEDAIDFLARRADALTFRPFAGRVALHLPCTQRHVVGSVPALRRLLARVPGLDPIPLEAGFGCCGAAGSAMLTDPARADGFRAPLLQQLGDSRAMLLLSANIGCRLHLQAGTDVPVVHPIDFLAGQLDVAARAAQ
ncbi:MAG TPA: (Fe-S)-binding protein, partial [Lysobacter sp.]